MLIRLTEAAVKIFLVNRPRFSCLASYGGIRHEYLISTFESLIAMQRQEKLAGFSSRAKL